MRHTVTRIETSSRHAYVSLRVKAFQPPWEEAKYAIVCLCYVLPLYETLPYNDACLTRSVREYNTISTLDASLEMNIPGP